MIWNVESWSTRTCSSGSIKKPKVSGAISVGLGNVGEGEPVQCRLTRFDGHGQHPLFLVRPHDAQQVRPHWHRDIEQRSFSEQLLAQEHLSLRVDDERQLALRRVLLLRGL